MKSRRSVFIALGLTLLLAGWVALQEGSEEATATAVAPRIPTSRPGAGIQPAAATPVRERVEGLSAAWSPAPESAARTAWSAPPAQALAAWSPPPPPPPPPAPPTPVRAAVTPPPALQAPPLPYTLIGRLEDGGQVMALISGPTGALGAKAGDVLDGQWRVDAVQPNAVTFTWLPANVSQTLTYKPS